MRAIGPALAGLGLLVAAAYYPATRFGFVWDDVIITTMPAIREWGGLGELWFSPTTAYREGVVREGHYWPLLYTTFWLEHKLWGLAPAGYHVVNLLLHFANTVLLWRLLARLAVPGALFAAAVFAAHPVHVEAVAWVIARKDLLAALCYLGAFLLWLDFVERPRARRYVAALALFAGAMLSKTIAVTFPAALLIAAYWKQGRVTAVDLRRVAPFLVVGLGLAALDLAFYAPVNLSFDYSFLDRTLIAAESLWFYAGQLVWPADLALLYAQWGLHNPLAWGYVAAAAALVGSLFACRGQLGRGPLAAVLCFGVTLAPVLGFFDFGYMFLSFAADRYQYLASAAGIALLAGLAARGAGRLPDAARKAAAGTALGVVVVLGAATWRQTHVYRDDLSLFQHAASRNPGSWAAQHYVGRAFMEAERWSEAEGRFRAAAALRPSDRDTGQNLAEMQRRQGRYQEAVGSFRAVISQHPEYALAHAGLGDSLFAIGDYGGAAESLGRSLTLAPETSQATGLRLLLGRALVEVGRGEEAADQFRRVLEADPGLVEAQSRLAAVRFGQARYEEALELSRAVVGSLPDSADSHANLGAVLVRLGRRDDAIASFERALELDPAHERAQAALSDARSR